MIRVDVRDIVGQYLSKMMDLDLIHMNTISGKSFYDYWYFSRKNAQFQKLFYLSQNVLDEEYILPDKAQKTIMDLLL